MVKSGLSHNLRFELVEIGQWRGEVNKYKRHGVPDFGWKFLVGKIIKEMHINAEKNVLRFILDNGDLIYASAVGDCCSTSWFEDIEYAECLYNNTILKIFEREMPERFRDEKTIDKDFIELYGWTMETQSGRCDIEMRNQSNGYYGGEVIVSDVISDQYHTEVDEHFKPSKDLFICAKG